MDAKCPKCGAGAESLVLGSQDMSWAFEGNKKKWRNFLEESPAICHKCKWKGFGKDCLIFPEPEHHSRALNYDSNWSRRCNWEEGGKNFQISSPFSSKDVTMSVPEAKKLFRFLKEFINEGR